MTQNNHFLAISSVALSDQMTALAGLSDKLNQLSGLADKRTAERAKALRERIAEFSAKVTLVGQVKAGKSALTSLLAGTPGLLPSDVNPWTSVVTTLTINAPENSADKDTKARFTFFDREEWDRLVIKGGRLGELAERTGAQDEQEDVRRQVIAMRQAAEKRLGKHFELLLGQTHSYGYFDNELIERYVCLGDGPAEQEGSAKTGRFADITRSAEIRLQVPAYPVSMTLCDTPGVNDTFMVREQITIRNLRGSEICVVVLSAHQALTTADMALMRIIATLDKRQTIIFVNRTDELSDAQTQIKEIREGIIRTLQQNHVENEVSIVFGSAKWGEAGFKGDLSVLSPESRGCLHQFAAVEPDLAGLREDEVAWLASGIPTLLYLIGERISEGSAQRLHDRISRSTLTLTNEVRATLSAGQARVRGQLMADVDAGDPIQAINEAAERYNRICEEFLAKLAGELHSRLQSSQATFVKRATDSLVSFLKQNGEQGTWSYDAAGFRALQKAAYTSFARSVRVNGGNILDEAARTVQGIYLSVVGHGLSDFRIAAPLPPQVPPPVGLGKTIALDLQQSWWRSWWNQRRSVEACANSYVHLIEAEAQSISDELETAHARPVIEALRAIFRSFMAEQQDSIRQLVAGSGAAALQSTQPARTSETLDERFATLGEILTDLEAVAA